MTWQWVKYDRISFLNELPRKHSVAITKNPQTLSSKYANNIPLIITAAAWKLESAKSKSVRSPQTILEFSAERTLNPLSWTHRFKTHALGLDQITSGFSCIRRHACALVQRSVIGRQARERERNLQLRDLTQKKPKGRRKRQNTEGWMDGASRDVEQRESECK